VNLMDLFGFNFPQNSSRLVGAKYKIHTPPIASPPMSKRNGVAAELGDAAAKRKASAAKGAATKKEKERIKADAERAEQLAKFTAEQTQHRENISTRLETATRNRMAMDAWTLEHAVPVYQYLVRAGAPPELAEALVNHMIVNRTRLGVALSFVAEDTFHSLHGTRFPSVTKGSDVVTALEWLGCTDVKWVRTEGTYDWPYKNPDRWTCSFTYQMA